MAEQGYQSYKLKTDTAPEIPLLKDMKKNKKKIKAFPFVGPDIKKPLTEKQVNRVFDYLAKKND